VLGNVFDVDTADPLGGFVRMAETYGPIFKISAVGTLRLLVSGPEIVDEICDDRRFDKKIGGGLGVLQRGRPGRGCSPPRPTTRCGCGRTTCS
jgi:cytochrome P450/NADPH-cytochrome P450 reductase